MPFANDRIDDYGLIILSSEGNRLDICHTEPRTYAEALSYSVGNKLSPTISSPQSGAPDGRQVVVSAISDGTITHTSVNTSDDAQYWAIVDTVNSRLLLAGPLQEAQLVTNGNSFTLTSFIYRKPALS